MADATCQGGSIMTEHSRRILSEALELSPMERAALVEELLSSFDNPRQIERAAGHYLPTRKVYIAH